jgi:hypothetical protein
MELNLLMGNEPLVKNSFYLIIDSGQYYVYCYNEDEQWYDPFTLDCCDEPEQWALLPKLYYLP